MIYFSYRYCSTKIYVVDSVLKRTAALLSNATQNPVQPYCTPVKLADNKLSNFILRIIDYLDV